MRFANLLGRVGNVAKAFTRFFGHIEKYSATEEGLKIGIQKQNSLYIKCPIVRNHIDNSVIRY
jgi:hypothetical protein